MRLVKRARPQAAALQSALISRTLAQLFLCSLAQRTVWFALVDTRLQKEHAILFFLAATGGETGDEDKTQKGVDRVLTSHGSGLSALV